MSLSLLKNLRDPKAATAARTQKNWQAYRGILERSNAGKSKRSDSDDVQTLMGKLGIDGDQVARDLETLKRADELTPIAAKEAALAERKDAELKRFYRERRARIEAERKGDAGCIKAKREHDDAFRAAQALAEIRRTRPGLFPEATA